MKATEINRHNDRSAAAGKAGESGGRDVDDTDRLTL